MSKKKEQLEKKKMIESLSNILSNTIAELEHSKSYRDTEEILENFLSITNRISQKIDEPIVEESIDQLQKILEESQSKKRKIDKEAHTLISKTIDLFNNQYGMDLSYDGNVDNFYSKTFPLISYYVNKNT
jgi:hypothetical protein